MTGRTSAATRKMAQRLAVGAGVAAWAAVQPGTLACISDPVPYDGGNVVDPLPQDSGVLDSGGNRDAGHDAGQVADPLPQDAGYDAGQVADPLPQDAGFDAGTVVDPPPADAGVTDAHAQLWRPAGGWRDSSPRGAVRTTDLPLFDPPRVTLRAQRVADGIRVSLLAGTLSVSTRWQAHGTLHGDGREVLWQPADGADRARVAVRTRGGIAVLSVGVDDVQS